MGSCGQGPVTSSCEHGTEPSDSRKHKAFLDLLTTGTSSFLLQSQLKYV